MSALKASAKPYIWNRPKPFAQKRSSHKPVHRKPVAILPREELWYTRDIYCAILTTPGPCFITGKPIYFGAVIRNVEPQMAEGIVKCFGPKAALFDAAKNTVTIYSEHVEPIDALHTAINKARGRLTKKMVNRVMANHNAQWSLYIRGLREPFLYIPNPGIQRSAHQRSNPMVGSEHQPKGYFEFWLNEKITWQVEKTKNGTATPFKPLGPVTVTENDPHNHNIAIAFDHRLPMQGENIQRITASINRATFIRHFEPATQYPGAGMPFAQRNPEQNPVRQARL